jgi:hypothetical protein
MPPNWDEMNALLNELYRNHINDLVFGSGITNIFDDTIIKGQLESHQDWKLRNERETVELDLP